MSSREQHHKTSEGVPPGGRPPNAQQQALLEGLALEMEEMIDKLFARSEEVGLCNHPLSSTQCDACKAAHPGGGGGRRFRRRCTRRWRAGICPVMIHGSRCHPCGSLTRRKSDSASCSATWHSSVAGRLELRRSSRSSPLHKPLAPVPPECCSAVNPESCEGAQDEHDIDDEQHSCKRCPTMPRGKASALSLDLLAGHRHSHRWDRLKFLFVTRGSITQVRMDSKQASQAHGART
jgi:hypothetical protein